MPREMPHAHFSGHRHLHRHMLFQEPHALHSQPRTSRVQQRRSGGDESRGCWWWAFLPNLSMLTVQSATMGNGGGDASLVKDAASVSKL
ncbi:hypothetical protein U1Q18_028037 [Sarracenia purpurea var. burkii]